jgi:lysophospholipase
VRFDLKMQMFREHPDLQLGGVSYRWLCETLTATSRLQTLALGGRSQDPILMLQADLDTLVKPAGQEHFCTEASRCQLLFMPGSWHEIFMETDAIRNEALSRAIRFFSAFPRP